MQAGHLIRVRTDKDTHFLGAIAQDNGLHETLTVDPQGLAAGKHCRGRLKALRILSKENLAWEVWLFGNSLFDNADADLERFLGRWTFAAGDGIRATVGGGADDHYHYYIDGLDVGIEDLDRAGALYIRLVNRSVAAKSADAAGALVIEFVIEPTLGW
jgi:hypothetical protein